MNNSKFKSLLILYALYVWFSKVSSSIIPAYLLSRGATINQMFLASVLQFIPMLLVLLFVRIKSARLSWRLALVSVLLAVFSVVNIRFNFQIYHRFFCIYFECCRPDSVASTFKFTRDDDLSDIAVVKPRWNENTIDGDLLQHSGRFGGRLKSEHEC